MRHLLVTNDFPPKLGGIQSYLWELWRRLPPEDVVVVTPDHPDATAFDRRQPYRTVRVPQRVLLPSPGLRRRVRALASEVGAGFVVLDPALPLGLLGPQLGLPYVVVLHGAEIAVPARVPLASALLGRVLGHASHLVAAGRYPEAEARRRVRATLPPCTRVTPGVDAGRFRPLGDDERSAARVAFGLPVDGPLVVGFSRLVRRKGMDILIEATARLAPSHPGLVLAVAGSGRDRARLEHRARASRAPARFLGTVDDGSLPQLLGSADAFAMLCRNRWGGLEQEGFGIVFLEAAACAVPQVAGASGGAAEAVVDGDTGFVVRRPSSPAEAASALARLLDDAGLRRRLGTAGRQRVVAEFDYDLIAPRLHAALASVGR